MRSIDLSLSEAISVVLAIKARIKELRARKKIVESDPELSFVVEMLSSEIDDLKKAMHEVDEVIAHV